jgi:hypothetical protein
VIAGLGAASQPIVGKPDSHALRAEAERWNAINRHVLLIVPTLRVGMPYMTLRVIGRGASGMPLTRAAWNDHLRTATVRRTNASRNTADYVGFMPTQREHRQSKTIHFNQIVNQSNRNRMNQPARAGGVTKQHMGHVVHLNHF